MCFLLRPLITPVWQILISSDLDESSFNCSSGTPMTTVCHSCRQCFISRRIGDSSLQCTMKKVTQIAGVKRISVIPRGPKKRDGPKLRAAKSTFREFTEKTTIHGLNFLGERDRSTTERVLWLLVFILAVYGATVQILNLWNKWQDTPVIVSFSDRATPAWQIPFPAVTICPSTKVRIDIFNVSRAMDELVMNTTFSESDYRYWKAVLQTCHRHTIDYYEVFRPEDLHDETYVENAKDLVDTLISMAPEFDEMFKICIWRNNKTTECNSLFQMIVTDDGICYTHNMINQRNIYRPEAELALAEMLEWSDEFNSTWSVQKGYDAHTDENVYPYRVISSGANGGIDIFLFPNEEDFVSECVGMFQGYNVYLHSPEDPPTRNSFYTVPYEAQTTIIINPRIVTTSEGISQYSPSKRRCYFPHERYLRYYKTYSEKTCYQECLTNITFSECGCVKYSYPRHKDIPVCGIGKLSCVFETAMKYVRLKDSALCDCKPTCTSLNYDAYLAQTKAIPKNKLGPVTTISVIFREDEFVTSTRSELYGLSDFLANCGGIFGLFIGLSVVSFVEVLYFCSIRFVRNIETKKIKVEEDAKHQVVYNP